jgi:hypothetical protein
VFIEASVLDRSRDRINRRSTKAGCGNSPLYLPFKTRMGDPPRRSGFAWTHHWREPDSNHRSRSCERLFWALPIGDGGAKGGATYRFRSENGQCLPGVAAHSLSLRGGTASSNPSSSIGESAANLTSVSLRDRDRSARFEFQPGGATRIRKAESGGALAGALDRPYRPKPAQSASATTAAICLVHPLGSTTCYVLNDSVPKFARCPVDNDCLRAMRPHWRFSARSR